MVVDQVAKGPMKNLLALGWEIFLPLRLWQLGDDAVADIGSLDAVQLFGAAGIGENLLGDNVLHDIVHLGTGQALARIGQRDHLGGVAAGKYHVELFGANHVFASFLAAMAQSFMPMQAKRCAVFLHNFWI